MAATKRKAPKARTKKKTRNKKIKSLPALHLDPTQNSTPKREEWTWMGEIKPEWPVWAKAFLASYCFTGNVTMAARAAGIDRKTAYNLRDSDEAFANAWGDAREEAADLLEEEARRRAHDGVLEPVFYLGSIVGFVRKYSDTLTIFLLKGLRPEKYRERVDVTDWRSEASKYGVDPEEFKAAIVNLLISKMAGSGNGGGAGGSSTPDNSSRPLNS